MTRFLALALLLAAVTATVSACGRRGALDAPKDTTYPKPYPAEYNAPTPNKTDDAKDKK